MSLALTRRRWAALLIAVGVTLDADPVSCRLLDDFAALVSHESGRRLSPAQAASIIGTATGVEDHLGCTDPS